MWEKQDEVTEVEEIFWWWLLFLLFKTNTLQSGLLKGYSQAKSKLDNQTPCKAYML